MNNFVDDKAPPVNIIRIWLEDTFKYSTISEWLDHTRFETFDEFWLHYINWNTWDDRYTKIGWTERSYYRALKAKCIYVYKREIERDFTYNNSVKNVTFKK